MLQARTRVLDFTLKVKFQFWFPGLFNAVNTDHEIEMADVCPLVFVLPNLAGTRQILIVSVSPC